MDLGSVWFVLWGVLWAVYFVLDGFDLGIGTIAPFWAKNETERRTLYNAMGPFWDGNEVWLITAGGVTFAAFPKTYAVMFSGLYAALLLLLFALILRGVSFEFRSKVESAGWRKIWDICNFLGSFLPALLLGVAFANIFKGIPINAAGINEGTLFDLLNPYGLAGGVFFVLLFIMHGALWLAIKTEGGLRKRAMATAQRVWPMVAIVAVLFLVFTWFATKLYDNYLSTPILAVIPILAVVGLVLSRVFMAKGRVVAAWASSGLMIATVTLFGVVGLYPNLLPSSLDPAFSMTIANSSSSHLTLQIMLGVTLVFIPLVIAYQAWALCKFSHPVTQEDLDYEEAY
jgi:cytochrome bd ubiquinol oxidase subunit II